MSWPTTLISYHRSPEFDEESIPDNLRKEHTLDEGIWAMVRVLEGRLRYFDLVADDDFVLEPGKPGFVEPESPHRVEPEGSVLFYIEFFKDPSSPSSAESDD